MSPSVSGASPFQPAGQLSQPTPATSSLSKTVEKPRDGEAHKVGDYQSGSFNSHFASFSDPSTKTRGMALQGNAVSSNAKYEVMQN
jgi:hypothetical protein